MIPIANLAESLKELFHMEIEKNFDVLLKNKEVIVFRSEKMDPTKINAEMIENIIKNCVGGHRLVGWYLDGRHWADYDTSGYDCKLVLIVRPNPEDYNA